MASADTFNAGDASGSAGAPAAASAAAGDVKLGPQEQLKTGAHVGQSTLENHATRP